jgi:hypothetical protein
MYRFTQARITTVNGGENMKWNYIAALATALAVMFVAGPAFADEGREEVDVEDIAEGNATDSNPWVIAPQPNEARSDEEAPAMDEESNDDTGEERPTDDAEGATDLPEDDTTIGIDDSEAKGEPLIAPAGDQEGDGMWGGSRPYIYLAIPAILGVAVVGAVLHRRRN